MKDFMNCSSLKTYTSQFKTCTNSLEAFTSFSDADMKWSFDKDVKSSDSSALILMSEFVQEFTDPDKYIQLTRCLLGMIKSDHTIKSDTPFYIFENGAFVTKEKLIEMESFVIEPFLLGIWHFIIMRRSDCNERGAATYQQWYPNRGKYAGTVSDCITQEIFVESIPKAAEDNNFEDKNQKATTQYKAPEKKEDPWAEIRGMRDSDKMIADLEAGGITSLDDLRGFFWNFKHPDDHTEELAELKAKIEPIEKLINMMKQHSQNYATYKEYQERSAFTQKSFRKKNAAAIDAFEEADKYIAEHIKPYYIKGKPPKQSDLQAKSTKLKEKYNALVPEHNAFLRRKAAASQYSRQVRNYLESKYQQERNRRYQEKKRSQQKKKDYLE